MPIEMEESALKTVADIVYKNSGIVFKESNLTVLKSRLSSKLKEKKMELGDYIDLLKANNIELMSFIDFVTTNFTSFFRNIRHFEILKENVLPEMIEEKRKSGKRVLKVWSAGCSTGEESYTIAIAIRSYFEENNIDLSIWDVEIIGSDISLDSLFIAKAGKYPAKSVEKIAPDIIERYFDRMEDADQYIIKDVIRHMVKFDFHNLIYDSNFDKLDITFCRNVMIYFDEDVQKKVVDKIYNAMNPKGYLFIGHSESLVGLYDGFKPRSVNKGIVYVRQ